MSKYDVKWDLFFEENEWILLIGLQAVQLSGSIISFPSSNYFQNGIFFSICSIRTNKIIGERWTDFAAFNGTFR